MMSSVKKTSAHVNPPLKRKTRPPVDTDNKRLKQTTLSFLTHAPRAPAKTKPASTSPDPKAASSAGDASDDQTATTPDERTGEPEPAVDEDAGSAVVDGADPATTTTAAPASPSTTTTTTVATTAATTTTDAAVTADVFDEPANDTTTGVPTTGTEPAQGLADMAEAEAPKEAAKPTPSALGECTKCKTDVFKWQMRGRETSGNFYHIKCPPRTLPESAPENTPGLKKDATSAAPPQQEQGSNIHGTVKGTCKFCCKDVLSTETRKKEGGLYYHVKCKSAKPHPPSTSTSTSTSTSKPAATSKGLHATCAAFPTTTTMASTDEPPHASTPARTSRPVHASILDTIPWCPPPAHSPKPKSFTHSTNSPQKPMAGSSSNISGKADAASSSTTTGMSNATAGTAANDDGAASPATQRQAKRKRVSCEHVWMPCADDSTITTGRGQEKGVRAFVFFFAVLPKNCCFLAVVLLRVVRTILMSIVPVLILMVAKLLCIPVPAFLSQASKGRLRIEI